MKKLEANILSWPKKQYAKYLPNTRMQPTPQLAAKNTPPVSVPSQAGAEKSYNSGILCAGNARRG
jgi:hypothetical protein